MTDTQAMATSGLCTWALRTLAGSFLGDALGKSTTSFLDSAHVWIWTGDMAQRKADELAPKIGRTQLTAVRSRS